MIEQTKEAEVGAVVTGKGFDVLVSVRGLPVASGHTEMLVSADEARRLAFRLLRIADEQDSQRRKIEAFKAANR